MQLFLIIKHVLDEKILMTLRACSMMSNCPHCISYIQRLSDRLLELSDYLNNNSGIFWVLDVMRKNQVGNLHSKSILSPNTI